MEDSFIKFKKKIILEILIKCLIISLSIGLISFSLPYLIIKINKIQFNILYLILIGLGVSIVLFVLLFLILLPNDKKVAVKLDKKLNLNQKVQTMVEYQNEDSFMISLQRQNTNSILSNISIKSLSMKFSAIFFVLIGLALSLCITAFAMPNQNETPEPGIVDPGYSMDDWTLLSLKQLVEYVEASNINESLKTKYVNELNGLIDTLEDTDKQSEMIETVKNAIRNIELELDIINTNNEIYTVLKGVSHTYVVTLASKINDLDLEAISNALDGFITSINGAPEAIDLLDLNFAQVLKSSTVNKNDEGYNSLIKLNNELLKIKNETDLFNKVVEVINEQKGFILAAFTKQFDNKTVSEYVVNELRDIFGLYENNGNNQGNNNPNNQNGNGNQNNQGTEKPPYNGDVDGGYGTGEVILGSDDSMFDPEKGKVEFKDVISNYQNDIIGRLEEGKIPEELKEYFEYYYDILFGTLEDEE